MVVASPEKVLLKEMWEVRAKNGRPAEMSVHELAKRLWFIQTAGVPIYTSYEVDDLAEALLTDVDVLESLGFVETTTRGNRLLTGAGELFACTLEYPQWVRERLAAAHDPAD